jgi:transketolase
VYVIIGDGESDEGQIWEAAMAASKFRLDNLTAILDYNQFQQTGPVREVMPTLEPLVDKWGAFGWDVTEIDGHRFQDIQKALHAAARRTGQPQIIIAHTLKGRGLSPFQEDDVNRKHGVPLTLKEATFALAELDEMKYDESFGAGQFTPELTPADVHGEI